jgi:tetratricopeptide (TPR) repeat protein
MNITTFTAIAPHLINPFVLIGFVLLLFFGIHSQLMKSGLLRQVDQKESSAIIRIFLRYGFWLALTLIFAGFGYAAWKSYMEKEKAQIVNLDKLAEMVAAKVVSKLSPSEAGAQDVRKAMTEAITALPKADAPAKSIDAALRALERGDTTQAQAIFAEVLQTKEAEGKKANKEAAAAARHLGTLAFLHDTKAALAAYHKAVELDPENADGWNNLGHLFRRTGELAKAEDAYNKVLALGITHQDKQEQAAAIGNLGLIYKTRGDLEQADKMYKKALELNEALGRKEGMANQYGNLGNVYLTRGDLAQSEAMYKKALELTEALGGKEGMAAAYGNLGIVYQTRGDLAQAEQMYKKSLELAEALGSKEGMANQYGNLGIVYKTRGDMAQAKALWQKSLLLFQEMKHPNAKMVQQLIDDLPTK